MESRASTGGGASEPLRILSPDGGEIRGISTPGQQVQVGDGNMLHDHNQPKPFHVLPSIANRHFIGRDNTLDLLQRRLFIEKESPTMALHGLGGVGKTQVALQLAYWVKNHLPEYSIFWVPELSEASFEQAYTEIERKLAIPPISDGETVLDRVRRHLSSDAAGKWLLVVDNADDVDMLFGNADVPSGLCRYFPASDNGMTLLTTRSREVAVESAGTDIIELQTMNLEEAAGLLKTVVKGDLLRDQAATAQLLEELNWLPLAITQAAAYINKNDITTSRYLELMHGTEKERMDLVSPHFHDSPRYPEVPNAIALTWLISFNKIRDSNPCAARMLEFMSFIEPKAIPRYILPPLNTAERQFATDMLCGYAFVTKRDDGNMFDMRDLVQLSTRLWLQKEGNTLQAIQCATRHMERVFPSDEHKNREIWRAYLPHAVKILRHDETQDMDERYELTHWVARCLLMDSRTREAVGYFESHSRWTESHLDDEEHPDRLSSQHNLARAYAHGDDRQTKKAVEMLQHVVAVRERTLGEEHHNRLASEHELASAYLDDGQVEPAVKLLQHVVTVKEKTHDEEDPDRLASEHELARAYRINGQIEQAIELLHHAVAVKEKTYDEEDPDRLASEYELARAYLDDGQVEPAMKLLQHVVAVQEKTLNEENSDRLLSQHELARAYLKNGQIEQAIALLRHVVAVEEKTLSEEHPSRLTISMSSQEHTSLVTTERSP
ncbi:uncharacterized protein PFLUO_LOCUS4319 [Penicillium psychrofluorescens]|uniref:uncharacterized protein n=1 Tax=Penicillium psychrofluorescens TaxID=3158075 RepID=UPI003CCCE065